jgi:hypothetical protein
MQSKLPGCEQQISNRIDGDLNRTLLLSVRQGIRPYEPMRKKFGHWFGHLRSIWTDDNQRNGHVL